MGRGRGKGKRGGRGGGGRKHFVSSLEELESRNDRDEAWAARRKAERLANGESSGDEDGEDKKKGDDSESEGEGSSSEGEGARGAGASGAGTAEEVVMEKKQPKAKGVSSLIEVANPNAKPKAGRMMKAKVCCVSGKGRRDTKRLRACRWCAFVCLGGDRNCNGDDTAALVSVPYRSARRPAAVQVDECCAQQQSTHPM